MFKPQYNFCLAVIRKKETIGFTLREIMLVYTPGIPQHDRARRKWCKDRRRLFSLACHMSAMKDRNISPRFHNHDIGDLVLWDIIPILDSHQNSITRLSVERTVSPDSVIILDPEFLMNTPGAIKWFKDVCDEFHRFGGGKYLLIQGNQKEVPLWAL